MKKRKRCTPGVGGGYRSPEGNGWLLSLGGVGERTQDGVGRRGRGENRRRGVVGDGVKELLIARGGWCDLGGFVI